MSMISSPVAMCLERERKSLSIFARLAEVVLQFLIEKGDNFGFLCPSGQQAKKWSDHAMIFIVRRS